MSHILVIKKDIAYQVELAAERRSYIKQLNMILPKLQGNSNIFYLSGNKPWLTQDNYTPFQQGMGYTLMVLYWNDGVVPSKLLEDGFLWNLGEQGYKLSGDKGFGYYSDIISLRQDRKKYKLENSNYYELYYDGVNKKLINRSKSLNKKLITP